MSGPAKPKEIKNPEEILKILNDIKPSDDSDTVLQKISNINSPGALPVKFLMYKKIISGLQQLTTKDFEFIISMSDEKIAILNKELELRLDKQKYFPYSSVCLSTGDIVNIKAALEEREKSKLAQTRASSIALAGTALLDMPIIAVTDPDNKNVDKTKFASMSKKENYITRNPNQDGTLDPRRLTVKKK